MRPKTFFLFLLLAIAAYAAYQWLRPSADPAFSSELIALDTASVTLLSIAPAGKPDEELLLKRERRTWIATQGNRSVLALPSGINQVLAPLVRMGSVKVAGRTREDGELLGLGAGQGIRVRVFKGAELLEDFLVGHQEWDADSLPITYVRIWKDEEAYAMPGHLKDTFWPGFETFRSKVLLTLDPTKVRQFTWETADPDSALVIHWSDSGWVYPSGMPAPELDTFLLRVRHLEGHRFSDQFDPVSGSATLIGRLTFSGTDWERPVEVSCFRDTLQDGPFIFSSSNNPDNFFSSDSNGLFRDLILPLQSWMERQSLTH